MRGAGYEVRGTRFGVRGKRAKKMEKELADLVIEKF